MQLRGEDSIFFIRYEGVWFPISCETSNAFNESVEMISTTTRDNNGWTTQLPTNQSYSISLEAVLRVGDNDLSYVKIRGMKRARTLIEWKRETWKGWYIDSGFAYITDIGDSNVVGEDITFNLNLVGFGAPLESRFPKILGDADDILTDNNNNAIWITT